MAVIPERLDQAIKLSGVAIDGISIGDHANKATWRVSPASMQAAAQPIIDAYADPSPAVLLDEQAQRETGEKKLQAAVLGLYECIPAPTMTKAQLKARIVAIYKSL